MTTTEAQTPFAKALRQWISELKRDTDKTSPFYEKVLAAQNDFSTRNGHQECSKCARDLSEYIRQLQKSRRNESKFHNLCSKLEPFVVGINGLMRISSTVAQAAPFEIGIVFAGAQLVLQLAASQTATFDKIVDILTEIARNLRCYDKLSAAYESSDEICELLIDAYKTIIGFWHRASLVLSRSSLRIAVTNLVKPIDAEWKVCLDSLQRNSQAVLALAQATSALESLQSQKLDLTKKIAKWIVGKEDVSKLLFRSDVAESNDIREEGTCKWVFEQPNFKAWLAANKNALAWYHAPPGSGKTVLSAAVAQHLEKPGSVIYFRYSFDDSTRKFSLTALRSIALQLRTVMGKVPPKLIEIYNKELDHHAYHLQDTEIAVRVVEAFIEQMPRVHIIIDGLDECFKVEEALKLFGRLVQYQTYGITKWFFVSRDEPIIRDKLADKLHAMEITPPQGMVMNDITLFLSSQGDKLMLTKCASCVQYWTAASEENFLYSKIMFDILCGDGVTCSDEIHDELQKFPPGLTGCYMRCLEGLLQRKEPERNLARRIFLFMACAAKPLTLSELCNALAIRMEAEFDDHQPGRVPTFEMIRSLGGSLIRLEIPQDNNWNEAKVKFVHKSVLDFFKQQPDTLGVSTDRTDLRRFFIDEKAGNLELGRYCLKYLQFKRYQSKVDIPTILANNDEHAFLKYAAAFWFEHLHRVDHSRDLLAEVKSFIQSSALWTCLAVQAKVRPHLFARYTELGGIGYALGLRRGELSEEDSIMVPLPLWIDSYKPDGYKIFQVLYNFVREWHEVLVLYPHAANQCHLDQEGRNLFPGLASSMSKSMRLSTIKLPENAQAVELASLFFTHTKLQARIAYLDGTTVYWHEASISAGEPSRSGAMPAPEQGNGRRLIRFSEGPQDTSASRSSAWSISLRDLQVQHCDETRQTFPPPKSCNMSDKLNDPWRGWVLVTESATATEYGSAVALHLTSTHPEEMKKDTSDSGYDSASGLDSDSDSGWSNSNDDAEHDAKKCPAVESDCLVICSDGEKPLWIPWTEQSNDQLQVSCTFHPRRKIVAFARRRDELEFVDLTSGKTSTQTIEDPAAARESAAIYCQDLRFSSCGQYLYHVLTMIAENGDIGSACEVSLSTFQFKESGGPDTIRPCAEVQRLAYRFGAETNRLRPPYVLTHWDEETLHLCLPLLSCNPKVARFDLRTKELDRRKIQTLSNPVFFPNSTPCRNPKILYRSSPAEKKDIFVLALDSLRQANERSDSSYPPGVIEWKIDRKDGWRDWDEATDGEEPKSLEDSRTYAQLRGTFLDADRNFNVVIRNGFDWTKKAFLSCA